MQVLLSGLPLLAMALFVSQLIEKGCGECSRVLAGRMHAISISKHKAKCRVVRRGAERNVASHCGPLSPPAERNGRFAQRSVE
jgi:hypothetical protein